MVKNMEQNLMLPNPVMEQMKQNDYLNNNTIYFDTEFDRDSCMLFTRQLKKLCEQELQKRDEDRKHIKIIISSYGGNVYDYYTCASMIEYYKEKGIVIETHCYGYAMSAGAKLLIIGSKGYRYATRYSDILLHQIQLTRYGHMTMQEQINDTKDVERTWKVLKGIIKSNTKLTDEEIENFTKLNVDVHYSAEEALEKGLIDHIL